jgi:hypothetical protein
MRNFLLKLLVWLTMPAGDRILFWRAWRLADRQVFEQDRTQYYGGTKHAIAYERIRTQLVRQGTRPEDLTGAVVHVAVAFRYLLSH